MWWSVVGKNTQPRLKTDKMTGLSPPLYMSFFIGILGMSMWIYLIKNEETRKELDKEVIYTSLFVFLFSTFVGLFDLWVKIKA